MTEFFHIRVGAATGMDVLECDLIKKIKILVACYCVPRKGANRVLTIYKKERGTLGGWSAGFQLARNSRHQIMTLLQRLPITTRERADLQPRTHKMTISEGEFTLNKHCRHSDIVRGWPLLSGHFSLYNIAIVTCLMFIFGQGAQ